LNFGAQMANHHRALGELTVGPHEDPKPSRGDVIDLGEVDDELSRRQSRGNRGLEIGGGLVIDAPLHVNQNRLAVASALYELKDDEKATVAKLLHKAEKKVGENTFFIRWMKAK
jgi:hypothetical protein